MGPPLGAGVRLSSKPAKDFISIISLRIFKTHLSPTIEMPASKLAYLNIDVNIIAPQKSTVFPIYYINIHHNHLRLLTYN